MIVEHLTNANLDCFKALAERAWSRPKSDEYYQWRYFDAPRLMTLLMREGDRCLATVSAFERRYRFGDEVLDCLEPFDWYALPEARNAGVGLRVMRNLLQYPKPMVSLGGTRFTLQMFPKLGFRTVAQATQFVLPLSGACLLHKRQLPHWAKSGLEPLVDAAVVKWFTPRRKVSRYEVIPWVALLDARACAIDGPGRFASLPDWRFFEWLAQAPRGAVGAGSYLPTVVARDGVPFGWSMSRIYMSGGLRQGHIFEVRLREPDPDLAAALVTETVLTLARAGADRLYSRSTSPLLCVAFACAGFRAGREQWPAMVRSRAFPLPPEEVALSSLADLAFLPLTDCQPAASAGVASRARVESAALALP